MMMDIIYVVLVKNLSFFLKYKYYNENRGSCKRTYIGEFNIIGSRFNPHRINFDSYVLHDVVFRNKIEVINLKGRKYKVDLDTNCSMANLV